MDPANERTVEDVPLPVDLPDLIARARHALAAEIREHGHLQDSNSDEPPKACIVLNSSLWLVAGRKHHVYIDLLKAFREDLRKRTGSYDLIEWNDATPTKDVLAVLDQP